MVTYEYAPGNSQVIKLYLVFVFRLLKSMSLMVVSGAVLTCDQNDSNVYKMKGRGLLSEFHETDEILAYLYCTDIKSVLPETLVASTDGLTSMMLDYEQSFFCNTQRNITMNVANISSLPKTNIAAFYNVTIKVKSFRVQAFQFGSPSSPSKYFGAGELGVYPCVSSLTE